MKLPDFSTFSLVARDPVSGELAIAGTSNGFGYGSVVPHIEAGVGAIATQAIVNLNYAAEGMISLRDGKSAVETIAHLLDEDPDEKGQHQLLIIDNNGITACHSGEKNYPFKGHICKENFACAGNTLVNEKTLSAIADSYETTDLPFALRIIKALQAGHEAGGDIRGIKSAAIKIVKGERTQKFWEGVILDLRTDENKNPLEKLEKLYAMSQANVISNKGMETVDPKEALSYFNQALELYPDNPEYMLWLAKCYRDLGNDKEANQLLEKVKTYPGHWLEYWERLLK